VGEGKTEREDGLCGRGREGKEFQRQCTIRDLDILSGKVRTVANFQKKMNGFLLHLRRT
jgi:hypothetical protein